MQAFKQNNEILEQDIAKLQTKNGGLVKSIAHAEWGVSKLKNQLAEHLEMHDLYVRKKEKAHKELAQELKSKLSELHEVQTERDRLIVRESELKICSEFKSTQDAIEIDELNEKYQDLLCDWEDSEATRYNRKAFFAQERKNYEEVNVL